MNKNLILSNYKCKIKKHVYARILTNMSQKTIRFIFVFRFIVIDYIFQIDKFIFCYWNHTQQLYYILCMLHWVLDTVV